MTSIASGMPTGVPTPTKKKARPNPSRRKASNLKKGGNVTNEVAESVKHADARPVASAQPTKRVSPPHSVPTQTPVVARKPIQQGLTQQTASSTKFSSQPGAGQATGRRSADCQGKAGKPATSLVLATPALVTGGLIGCAAGAAVLLGAGLWKDVGGVDSAILAVRTAKLCMNNLCEEVITSLKAGTYSSPEALDMLRRTTLAYASAIPGGAPVVERIFREINMVRKQRGREVDKVVVETYNELSKAGERSAGPVQMQAIILRNLAKLSKFAANASQDVLARNPKLRPLKEGAVKALKRPPEPKIPTVKLNMSIQQRPAVAA